jgi:hypothetical protein
VREILQQAAPKHLAAGWEEGQGNLDRLERPLCACWLLEAILLNRSLMNDKSTALT